MLTTLIAGQDVTPSWRPGRTYRVTGQDNITVAVARGALIVAAKQGITLSYTDLEHITGVYRQSQSKLLDLLSVDCHQRGEPSLAALVVRKDTKEPGDGFVTDTTKAQDAQECYDYWQ